MGAAAALLANLGWKAFEVYDTVVSSMCMLHGPAGIVLRADWLAPLNPCERVHDITFCGRSAAQESAPLLVIAREHRESPSCVWKRALARAA